tara:strand:- start:1298 stop:1498 length:201 start_codon:yes stop_codon:yes gene_type:complete
MTIDEMISSLEDAKKDLGGDTEILTEFECNGKGDCVKIRSLSWSKIFHLRFIIDAPWWAYDNKYQK